MTKEVYGSKEFCVVLRVYENILKKESSDEGERDTPVPIPNTEVKPLSADGTWLETTWESKTLLVSLIILGSSTVEQPAVNR